MLEKRKKFGRSAAVFAAEKDPGQISKGFATDGRNEPDQAVKKDAEKSAPPFEKDIFFTSFCESGQKDANGIKAGRYNRGDKYKDRGAYSEAGKEEKAPVNTGQSPGGIGEAGGAWPRDPAMKAAPPGKKGAGPVKKGAESEQKEGRETEEKTKGTDRLSDISFYYSAGLETILGHILDLYQKAEKKRLRGQELMLREKAGAVYEPKGEDEKDPESVEEAGSGIGEEIEDFVRLRPEIAEKIRSGEIEALPPKVVHYLKNGEKLPVAWLRYENETLLSDYMTMIERLCLLEKALKEERAKNQ